MNLLSPDATHERHARCIDVPTRPRRDIDRGATRGCRRGFMYAFRPDGLTLVDRTRFAAPAERRPMHPVQGRAYANTLGAIAR